MGLTAAVVGASGYAGGELVRLLAAHPELELTAVAAGASAGRDLAELHPALTALGPVPLLAVGDDAPLPAEVAGADVVFLALPHGASAPLAARLPAAALVVDLSADHRLTDPADWERCYGGPAAEPWLYGLPEIADADALAAARRIANPGCYPTAVALALAPLLAAGLVEPTDVVVVAASGTSGAGRTPRPHLLGTEVMGDLSAYKVAAHQHVPEIRQTLAASAGAAVTLSFTPVLAPMPRGILATCTARLAPGADTAALRGALAAAYDAAPFVHLLADGRWPHTAATAGSNACHLQVVADDDAGRAVVVAALDNLGKGAAGQAVQNANLALGLAQTAGLTALGVAP